MSKTYSALFAFAAASVTALASNSAHADININFTHMSVNDCNEVGTCDWKLSCALGNQQEVEFLNMVEANTNEDAIINRILFHQNADKVAVTCTALEHDGGIGAEWEQVGTGTVLASTTGRHMIRLNQHRDEGDVTVHFVVEGGAGTTGAAGGGVKPLSSIIQVSAGGDGAIRSGSGKCLDVHAPDQFNNGGHVQVWDCNNTMQQTWRFEGNAIRSGAGKCLDVHAPDQFNNGGRVQVWDCNNTMQQTWRLEGNAIRSGAGKCLDVHAPDQFNNGGRVQVWDCNNTMQQTWKQ